MDICIVIDYIHSLGSNVSYRSILMCEAVKMLIQKGIWIDGHNNYLSLTDIDRVNDAYFTNIVKYALTKHEFKDEFFLEMFEPIQKARLKLQNERKAKNEANNVKSKQVDARKKSQQKGSAKRTDTKPSRGTNRVQSSKDGRGKDRCSVRHERVQPKLSGNIRARNGSRSNGSVASNEQNMATRQQRQNKQFRARKAN